MRGGRGAKSHVGVHVGPSLGALPARLSRGERADPRGAGAGIRAGRGRRVARAERFSNDASRPEGTLPRPVMTSPLQYALMVGPLAFYLWLLACWNSGRSPRVVSGLVDHALLVFGVGGVLAFGPLGQLAARL